MILVSIVVLGALFADFIAPFPEHAGAFVDFANYNKAPSSKYLMGTDLVGRDQLSRILYAYRVSLGLGAVVLLLSVPIGVTIGLLAGYIGGWVDYVLMRITDVFLSIPPLVLALAIMALLKPTLINGMIAVTAMWWPWYAVWSITSRVARSSKAMYLPPRSSAHPKRMYFFEKFYRTACRLLSPK